MKFKLKKEFKGAAKIKMRFNSVGKFYPVSEEKALEMMEAGTLPREYWDMFEPTEDLKKAAEADDKKKGKKSEAKLALEAKAKEAKEAYDAAVKASGEAEAALASAEDKAKAKKDLDKAKAQVTKLKAAYEKAVEAAK